MINEITLNFVSGNYYYFYKQKGHLFPMTIDNLNKSNLIPNKDYNKEKLLAGMLQLPQDFLLCVDETVLSAGELNQKGFFSL
jgi:hypothetical protein